MISCSVNSPSVFTGKKQPPGTSGGVTGVLVPFWPREIVKPPTPSRINQARRLVLWNVIVWSFAPSGCVLTEMTEESPVGRLSAISLWFTVTVSLLPMTMVAPLSPTSTRTSVFCTARLPRLISWEIVRRLCGSPLFSKVVPPSVTSPERNTTVVQDAAVTSTRLFHSAMDVPRPL